jgi:LacI family transcriptional regulator
MAQTKTTLRDVAERSGFSTTTVSHVLNDAPGKRIPDATRIRVQEAAAELSYRPNRVAQGLRLQRSNLLGFISDHVATSPHAGQVILGAQDAASEHGRMLMLMSSGDDAELEELEIRALLDRQVDGIIYATEYHRVLTPPAALAGAPTVLLDARSDGPAMTSVVPDEVGGALTAVLELTGHGHRRIGFLNNVDDIPATVLRLQGFQSGLRAARCRYSPGRVVSEESEARGGYRAALRLLSQPDRSRPTGLFCFNDRMAMGAYQAAADLGLSIPQDLSIIGFDNQELIADGLRPGLTTVALPHFAMGRWAVNALLAMINNPDGQPAQETTLSCPLVRRASVGPPPRS